jgi:hypothetical protein
MDIYPRSSVTVRRRVVPLNDAVRRRVAPLNDAVRRCTTPCDAVWLYKAIKCWFNNIRTHQCLAETEQGLYEHLPTAQPKHVS